MVPGHNVYARLGLAAAVLLLAHRVQRGGATLLIHGPTLNHRAACAGRAASASTGQLETSQGALPASGWSRYLAA